MTERVATDLVEAIVTAILAEIAGLRTCDALRILNRIEQQLLDLPAVAEELSGREMFPVERLLDRRRCGKIERDPEVRNFIHQCGRIPFTRIAALCRERFGVKRAPSKSGIHRYSQRLRDSHLKIRRLAMQGNLR